MPYTIVTNTRDTKKDPVEEAHLEAEYEDEGNEDAHSLWPSAGEGDYSKDEDPLDKLSSDEAVWAYQRMPHDDLPLWEPKPTRPWLEPLIRLIGIGAPLLSAWQQGKPLLGPLPEPRQSGLVVDEPWKRLYASMNTMEHREPLIVAMKKALDEWEQGQEIQEGGYAGELHRGRKLVQRLEESASEALDEVLAREVLDYLILSDLVAIRSEKSTRDAASLDVMEHSCNEGAGQACISGVPRDVDGKAGHVASGGGVTAPLVSVVVSGVASSVGRPVMYESIAVLQAAPSAVSSLAAAVRSATSSSMLRRTVLGSLLIGVPAGAYGLYKWIMGANESGPVGMENSFSSTKQGIEQKPSQQEELMELFEQLDVRYLDFLFELEPRELENGAQAHWRTNRAEREGAGSTVSPGDDQEYRMGVQEQIDEHPETQDFIMEPLGRAIFEQLKNVVNLSPEIERAKWLSKNEKDVVYLLKLIEVADVFSREFSLGHSEEPIYLTLNKFVAMLRAIAEGLPGRFAVARVAAFKQVFGWGGLNAQSKAPVDDMSRSRSRRAHAISDADFDPVEVIKQHGETVLDDIKLAYDPILYLNDYLDNYIDSSLSEFNREKNTIFTKHDSVKITLFKKPTGGIITHRNIREHTFSMSDIVTGRHLLIIKETLVDVNLDKDLVVEHYTSDTEKELVAWLWQRDLQVSMLSSLTNYRGGDGSAKRHAYSRVLQANILSHCLSYLRSPLRRPGFEDAVNRFVAGDEIAREVLFNGTPLHGLFFIPYGTASGVLFSVDEETFFHIDEKLASRDPAISIAMRGRRLNNDRPLPQVPMSSEFRDFILKRMPLTDYERHRNTSFNNGVFGQLVDIVFADEDYIYTPTTPFSFRYSEGIEKTANIAIFHYLQRLESDIDRIVYSPSEEAEELRMESIKRYLFISSLITSAFMSSSGSLLFRTIMLIMNIFLDIRYVLATLRQSQIVDDPESADAYLNEAIIAGTVSALVNIRPGVKLGASGVKRVLNIYGSLKGAGSKGVAALSAKMRWSKLSYSDKIDVMKATVASSEDAVELVRLSPHSDALEHSIRRAVPEEQSMLRNMDCSLIEVRAGLKSDLTLLRGPNIIYSVDTLSAATASGTRLRMVSDVLGPESSIIYTGGRGSQTMVVRAHGGVGTVNDQATHSVAVFLREHTEALGMNMASVNMIDLQSCYSGLGGRYSTAQIMANRLGKNVRGYRGQFSQQLISNNPAAGKIFRPMSRDSSELLNPERMHQFLWQFGKLLRRIRRVWRRLPRSVADSGFEAISVPQLNRDYREFLVDTMNLIEGRYSIVSFGEKHGINVDALIDLMSNIDRRSGMDDNDFLLCFEMMFAPGETAGQQGTVLFEELLTYSDQKLIGMSMEVLNVDSRGEVNKGDAFSIGYSILVGLLESSANWVGVYRANSIPGIDNPVSWKYLEGSSGNIDIDTSLLDEGEYTARFFYDGSYDELGGHMYFYVQ